MEFGFCICVCEAVKLFSLFQKKNILFSNILLTIEKVELTERPPLCVPAYYPSFFNLTSFSTDGAYS